MGGIIAIDLGTTNIKVSSFTNLIKPLLVLSKKVNYFRQNQIVEFNPDHYFCMVINLLETCYKESFSNDSNKPIQIVLTGQAESLVLLDSYNKPVRNAISWLDMRSIPQCKELASVFDEKTCFSITGQPKIIPTWPITKLLWLKTNEPNTFRKTCKIMLLKDYINFRLTGKFFGEYSIYSFSYYFNIYNKGYWKDMLNYVGISRDLLPSLIEPCSIVGNVLPNICTLTNLPPNTFVNIGTLDHFAGMIGTGNIREGNVSESAGTVSSIATFASKINLDIFQVPLYYGPFKDSYIYLPVCESGGISLDWFLDNILNGISYKDVNMSSAKCDFQTVPIFLPYITGVNPPEYNPEARGVFYGLSIEHNRFDLTLAIMMGVSFLLKKNINYLIQAGINVQSIITTGGGSRSELWNQLKADILNKPVILPENEEACCMGCAIIGAVSQGTFTDYTSAIKSCIKMKHTYVPSENFLVLENKFNQFNQIYKSLFTY